MFGLNTGERASENFYRNIFAIAAFAVFAAAIATDRPIFYALTLIFGAISRTAVKKAWRNPAFCTTLPWLVRAPEEPMESDGQNTPDEE
jgi:hypothetical protein